MKEHSFVKTDVCQVLPNNPKKVELRNKFLSEHTHSEEEVRFFFYRWWSMFLYSL